MHQNKKYTKIYFKAKISQIILNFKIDIINQKQTYKDLISSQIYYKDHQKN